MLIRTDIWDVVTQNNSLNYMLFQFLFQWINQFSKCNKQHSNPNDAEVKKTILSTQTELNYFFSKATFKR